MRKVLTTTVLTTGLFAASLAGAGSASASTGPQILDATGPGIALDTSDAVETAKEIILGGCTTQFVAREVSLALGSTSIVTVSGLDVTVHGSRALTFAVANANSTVTYVICVA